MNMPPNTDGVLEVWVNKETATVDDGRYILDPLTLPAVCPKCGGEGTIRQRLRVNAPYDLWFWLPVGGFIGGPILFGLSAGLVYWLFGNDALQNYVPYAVFVAILLAALGGLGMSRTNRENWFLTFTFCSECTDQLRKLTRTMRVYGWMTLLCALVLLTLPMIQSALRIPTESLQTLVWIPLGAALIGLSGFLAYRIKRAVSRGATTRWMKGHEEVRVTYKSQIVARTVKSKLQGYTLRVQ